MKHFAILLSCLALAGCKKAMSKLEEQTQLGKDEQVKMINRKGDLSVGNGSGGAVQAVRKAAARTVNFNDLDQLQKIILTAEATNLSVPNAQQIMEEIRQAGSIMRAVNEEIIILTNNTQREGILAYTQWPQRANDYYAVKLSGVVPMSRSDLESALHNQGTQNIKLSN